MAPGSAAEWMLAPLDAARAAVLRALGPLAASLSADRQRRVQWLGIGSVIVAFVLTGVAPLWCLALGPVVLGVPHLLADVRYLVVRPGLHRDALLMAAMGAPLLALALGAGPQVGLLAMVPAVLGRPTRALAVALLVFASLWLAAWRWPFEFQLALLHAHNLVAIGLWWTLAPRGLGHWWIPVLATLGSIGILGGALDAAVTLFGGWTASHSAAPFEELVATHAPGVDPVLGARLVLSFCFLQSIHYAVWLRLIPDDARGRRAPRTFRASWRALVEEFSLPALLGVVVLALLIMAWGVVDLSAARSGYLHLAAFHGYLELAVAARWFVRGRP